MNDRDLPMRVLSLWRPWPAAILLGPKRVENRRTRWKIPDGGMLLVIHGAKRHDQAGEEIIRHMWPGFDRVKRSPPHPCLGTGLLGAVLVRDVVRVEAMNGDPWASGPWCYRLSHPVAFRKRWECRGSQGLWKIDDAALEELIRREWAEGVESGPGSLMEAVGGQLEMF